MIKITDKNNCCGCAACVQACPKQCISFNEDEYGFRYPFVDERLCIHCGLCEKVCPVIHQNDSHKPLNVYAAMNPNEKIRLLSSSGGIFTLLAEAVIDEGGVVFGARFDSNWEVKHDYTDTKEGLAAFRGSKYVQSRVGDTYKQVKSFLSNGRKVLYSGTSCQIAGLKKYLRTDYANLITVDVVCHGAPSPLVWRTYLDKLQNSTSRTIWKNKNRLSLNEKPVITNVFFRDKTRGWKKYAFVVKGMFSSMKTEAINDVLFYESMDRNLFMQMFLKDLCLRPSCSSCPAKKGKCGSDITMADYWGISAINAKWDDDKGTSLVLINTDKGNKIWGHLNVHCISTSYEGALRYNPSLEHSVHFSAHVSVFWDIFFSKDEKALKRLLKSLGPSFIQKKVLLIKSIVVQILRFFHLK